MRGKLIILMGLWLVSAAAARADDLLSDFLSANDPIYEHIRVEQVISADTILLENNEKIRLIGLKALPAPDPERSERDEFGFVVKSEQPFPGLEQQALRFAKNLLENKYVRLEFDTQKKDPHFLTLAYVFLKDNEIFVNAAILQNGYASLHIRPPNTKYAPRLRQAYRQARQDRKGIHGEY